MRRGRYMGGAAATLFELRQRGSSRVRPGEGNEVIFIAIYLAWMMEPRCGSLVRVGLPLRSTSRKLSASGASQRAWGEIAERK